MNRGDIVTVAAAGDFGKPRPAVVIQSDLVAPTDSVLVCLLTTELRDAPYLRFTIMPEPGNGLNAPSQAMVEKILAVRRSRCGPRIGALTRRQLNELTALVAIVIGVSE